MPCVGEIAPNTSAGLAWACVSSPPRQGAFSVLYRAHGAVLALAAATRAKAEGVSFPGYSRGTARAELLQAGATLHRVTPEWVANHYRWLLWKFASYARLTMLTIMHGHGHDNPTKLQSTHGHGHDLEHEHSSGPLCGYTGSPADSLQSPAAKAKACSAKARSSGTPSQASHVLPGRLRPTRANFQAQLAARYEREVAQGATARLVLVLHACVRKAKPA